MRGRLGMAVAVLLVAGCADGPGPTEEFAAQAGLSLASTNEPHFSFLPPLAPATVTGDFNPSLKPAVEICRLDAAGGNCVPGAPLARFTAVDGEIQVSLENEQYQVNWQISGIEEGQWYRIQVLSGAFAGARLLGSVELQGAAGGGLYSPDGGSRNIESTLPIKFRIEHGALCTTRSDDLTDEPCLVFALGPDGGTFVTEDKKAGLQAPPGALTSEWINVYIERYEPGEDIDPEHPENNNYPTVCLPSSYPQAEGCYRFKSEPALSELEFQDFVGQFNQEVVVAVCPDPQLFLDGTFDQYDLYKWDEKSAASLQYLPERSAPFVNCPGSPEYVAPPTGGFAAARLLQPFRSLVQLFVPSPLYAGSTSPYGGGLKDFSRVGWLRPLSLSIVSGDGQTGYAGLTVVDDPVVRVVAAGAKVTTVIPVANVPIQFAASGDGSASPAAAVTNGQGYASTVWTLAGTPGANSLVVTATNPLAPAGNVFPNQAGVWGTVTFGATGIELPPPPPPARYDVVFLSPVQKGKLTPKDLNVEGVPVTVRVCATATGQCWLARRTVATGDYRFQWKAEAGYPAGGYTFTVLEGTTVLRTLTAVVAKDGSSPPKGVDFTFQLGSTIPIKFLLLAK